MFCTAMPRHPFSLLAATSLLTAQVALAQPLPEGNQGIASKYPHDQGIERDPAVILADDFEGHENKSDLGRIWNSIYNQTKLTREQENVYAGAQAIEFSVPADRIVASGAARYLDKSEHQDVVFLRYYSKFARNYDVLGGAHVGGGISAAMYNRRGESSAGTKANGRNHFAIMLDHGRWPGFDVANPGYLGIYIYHLGQRHQWGDGFFPTGMVIPNSSKQADFGPDFVPRSNIVTELGIWHCHEVMLKANTPGKSDGRVAAWVDGKLAMDFPRLRFRDIESLKIDHLQIGLNINTKKHPATKKWYDNVVAATSYIGPISAAATEKPWAPRVGSPGHDRSGVLKKTAAKLRESINNDRWDSASTAFALSVWEDFARAHASGVVELANHRVAGEKIDVDDYNDYLGSYGKQKFTVLRDKDGRLVVHLGEAVLPAAASGGMILVATGKLVDSRIPPIGGKPYAALEIYCLARVKGQYYLFFSHETPTEYHRIKKHEG